MPDNVSTAPDRLTARGVRFGYIPGVPIVSDLTAELAPGELTVLIGPNAAGKSTFLRLLLGHLEPDAGSVKFAGHEMHAWNPARRAGVVSYVPQRAGASFAFTVEEVVRLGRYAQRDDPAAIDHALAVCDLAGLRSSVFNRLSFGQQQRVLLARAIAQSIGSGRVMLLDEPGSAMDLWHVHRMMQMLTLLAKRGLAVLVVLHDLNLAARYAQRVWLMDQGRLVAQGEWSDVLRPEILEPIYRVKLTEVVRPAIGGTTDLQSRPLFLTEPADTLTEV